MGLYSSYWPTWIEVIITLCSVRYHKHFRLTIVLVIHSLCAPSSFMLGSLAIDIVCSFGFAELIDLTASNASNKLLGKGVVDLLACGKDCQQSKMRTRFTPELTLPALLILEQLHGTKGSPTGKQLVAELALMLITLVLVIHAVV